MGAVCCCFHVDYFESHVNPNSSMYRNSPCISGFLQNFINLYTSCFNRGGMQSIPSSIESASTTSLDDSLSDMYHSPPRPLPYDADPRCSHFVSRHEKGSSCLGDETEPLRGDTDINSQYFSVPTKWNKSVCKDGSKEEHTESSPAILKSKVVPGVEIYYAESDDGDVCPTCLEEYTPENPKIKTKCSHHFHLSCIYEWMERSETCPVCGKVMAFDENS